MLRAAIKLAVVLLLIKEIWLLLQIPSVADAVISFVMVGQVPGTERLLTPDEVIKLLVGVFILASLLIFRKEWVGLCKRLFRRSHAEEAAHDELPAKMPIEHPAIAFAPKRQRFAPFFQQLQSKLRHKLHGLRTLAMIRLFIVRTAVGQWSRVAWANIKTAAFYAWKAVLVIYLLISVLVSEFWTWLKPYIHRYDRWLDKKLHQNEHTAAMLSVGNDIKATFKRWVDEARALDNEDLTAKQTRK